MSYKWGGFDPPDLFNFFVGLDAVAGDITDDGNEVNCATGVDCSGYVSRVWQQNQKYSTGTLPDIATPWDIFDMYEFDLLNKPGHAMLVHAYHPYGGFWVTEATTRSQWDRVVLSHAPLSYIGAFSPYRNNILLGCTW